MTPIYEYTPDVYKVLPIQREIKSKIDTIYKSDKFANPPGWNDGVTTNFHVRTCSITDYELTNLQEYIMNHVHIYLKEINPKLLDSYDKFIINRSWFNVTEKNQGQDWHSHSIDEISGCYYYQTSENDGNIEFKSPNPYDEILFPYAKSSRFCIPSVGKIILFPGWLLHRVIANKTDNTRISIAFNISRPTKTLRQEM